MGIGADRDDQKIANMVRIILLIFENLLKEI